MEPEITPNRGLPRWADVLLAGAGLVVASPLLAACAAAVVLTSPGPVLYRQTRVGRGGRHFIFYKLRTMRHGASGPGITSGGDLRVTRVGRFLRKSKLDELPSLWNVLRGDMALVGPRPELPAYVDLNSPEWREVLAVRPGLTDPVTLSLRNEERLLAAWPSEPELFYQGYLVPFKLAGYRRHLATRTWQGDLALLARSIGAVLHPASVDAPALELTLPDAESVILGGRSRFSVLRLIQLVVDLGVLFAAFVLAYALRYDFDIPRTARGALVFQLPWMVLLQLSVLYFTGIQSFVWRYIGLQEVGAFTRAAVISALPALAFRLLLPEAYQAFRIPLSVIFIDTVLAFGGLTGVRVLRRLLYERFEREGRAQRAGKGRRKPVLLVGAGRAGGLAVREIQGRGDMDLEPLGFVDDDPLKQGMVIHGIKVLGTTDDIPNLARRLAVDHVILTIAQPAPGQLQRIVAICERERLKVRTIPGLYELLQGTVAILRSREVPVEDLLGREPVRLDAADLARFLTGKRAMVTGAGGVIGAELARQVARFAPARLLLVDRAEFALATVDRELRGLWPQLEVVSLITDVGDQSRMRRALANHRPEVILHAAAHTQSSLLEANVGEAVRNNVLAYHAVAQLAGEIGVEAVVLVSSDRAHRPDSVMGASKRLAELAVQGLGARYPGTRYVAVRFGGVMGAPGSVLETFRRQLAEGGPLTVTHPEKTRFFVTLAEASQLVLQAGAMGDGGEIFVLDMGEPVKIVDLARKLITLSGFEPDREIGISFTGLRTGEKLTEEPRLDRHQMVRTRHPKIFACGPPPGPPNDIEADLARLAELVEKGEDVAIRDLLASLIPDHRLHEPAETPTIERAI